MVLAHDLDRQFAGLGPGIAEEHGVGETVGDQALGQAGLLGNLIQIRGVPELLALFDQGLDQMRMAMAQRIDRDARGEIQVALAIGGDQIGAFAPLESEFGTGIGRHDSGNHRESVSVRSTRAIVIFISGGRATAAGR
jgi:hypothetical protein